MPFCCTFWHRIEEFGQQIVGLKSLSISIVELSGDDRKVHAFNQEFFKNTNFDQQVHKMLKCFQK
jgi:hypothetical protein